MRFAGAGLGSEDIETRLDIRLSQSPQGAADQAVDQLRREFIGQPRMAVTRQHQLFIVGQQSVERMQKLLLRRRLAGQEMQVIDEQYVAFPEALTKSAKLA